MFLLRLLPLSVQLCGVVVQVGTRLYARSKCHLALDLLVDRKMNIDFFFFLASGLRTIMCLDALISSASALSFIDPIEPFFGRLLVSCAGLGHL